MSKPNFICLVSSPYTLMLYFLIKPEAIDDTLFISDSDLPIHIRVSLKHHLEIKKHIRHKNGFINFLFRLKRVFYKLKMYFILKYLASTYDISYGNDGLPYAKYFLKKPFITIEDGVGNYLSAEVMQNREELLHPRRLFPKKVLFNGRSKNVQKIYLTGLAKIPQDIKHKVKLINPQVLWSHMHHSLQDRILSIFGIDQALLDQVKDKKAIVLSQSLLDAGLTVKQHINIIEDMVKKLLKTYKTSEILLKTHYKESLDCSLYFKDLYVFNKPIPVEILTLLGIRFEKAITVMSTAILGFHYDLDIEFIGTAPYAQLVKKFGIITLEDGQIKVQYRNE